MGVGSHSLAMTSSRSLARRSMSGQVHLSETSELARIASMLQTLVIDSNDMESNDETVATDAQTTNSTILKYLIHSIMELMHDRHFFRLHASEAC